MRPVAILFLFAVFMVDGADAEELFKDCTREDRVVQLCLQDHLIECGSSCAFLNTTVFEKNVDTCATSTVEFCLRADCCPACFGETQAVLDCEFTRDEEDAPICNTQCTCTDVEGWHDSGGSAYDCQWYANDAESRCSQFGDKNPFLGYVANSACCACKMIITSSAPGVAAILAAMGGVIATYMMM